MVLAVNMPAQEPQAGAGSPFQAIHSLGGHLSPLCRADRHKHVVEIDGVSIQAACKHRAAAHDNGGKIEPGGSHHHTGDDLVAVGDQDQSVESVRLGHNFHGVRNQLAAGQRVLHAQVIHGQAIADTDGVTLKRRPSCHTNPGLYRICDLPQMSMAGDCFVIRTDHANKGLGDFAIRMSQCSQQ